MFNIPENQLPESLKDEARLNVLFAPLRSKGVNAKDWEDKISSWKSIIKKYCEANNVYSFTLSSLNLVFVRHGRTPPCLEEVISDMIQNHEVEVTEIFLRKACNTWSGWLTDVIIKRPLAWSYNTVKKTVFPTKNSQYVHLEVVKNKSEELLQLIPDNFKNKVLSLKELLKVTRTLSGNLDNTKLLLHYLENKQHISVKVLPNQSLNNELDTLLVKIGQTQAATPITDVEVVVYKLEQNEKVISKHLENLEDEIDTSIENAKDYLRKNHKQLAKSCLVKKHQLEKQLEQKANALRNVQNCLEQLKGAHSNAHVWEAYKNALDAFNTTYRETGLDEDAIDDTMVKLEEALDTNDDIQSALARSPMKEEDTTALEQELEDLLKADIDDQDQPPNDDSGVSDDFEKRLEMLKINLPEVPESSPDVSVQEAI